MDAEERILPSIFTKSVPTGKAAWKELNNEKIMKRINLSVQNGDSPSKRCTKWSKSKRKK
jgi:hypothetical protein